jgi:hypothetical protein
MGMWMMYLVGNSAYNAIENERPIAGPLFGIAAGFVYISVRFMVAGVQRKTINIQRRILFEYQSESVRFNTYY